MTPPPSAGCSPTAAPPAQGDALVTVFADALRTAGLAVETGQFGADMAVRLVNDGPVTIWLQVSPQRTSVTA